jgi:arabinose-5-phosphate isomerase
MKDYFCNVLKSIDSSIEKMDEDAFEKLVGDSVSVLNNGGKLIASGLGKNVPICDKFVGTMLSFGLNATFLHTNTAMHGDLGAVRDGDLVIILSKSGETAESLYLLEHLKKRDVIIWAITFVSDSSLAIASDNVLVLDLDNEGDKWNMVPNNSTTLNLIVLQGLVIMVADRLGVTLEDFRRNHPGGHIGEVLREKK